MVAFAIHGCVSPAEWEWFMESCDFFGGPLLRPGMTKPRVGAPSSAYCTEPTSTAWPSRIETQRPVLSIA